MRFRRFVLPLALSCLLAGCAGSDGVEPAALPRVNVQELDVSFAFREPLTLRVSQEEALLSGPTTRMQVQQLDYAEKKPAPAPNVPPPWALPYAIAKEVRDQRSCGPLKSASVYLPVDTGSPMRCDLVMDPSGRPVVWMVGLGRPFEDVPFLQSSFLVLEDTGFLLFSYVESFPESDATAQWLADTFEERHPGMSTLRWPNKSFMLLSEETAETLGKQVDPPSEEVRAAMDDLRAIAFSVGPYRETPDR